MSFVNEGETDPLSRLVLELSKLPGIGEKTATRLAYFIVKREKSEAESLAHAILDAKRKIQLCERCANLSDLPVCRLCSDPRRDPSVICVVERPSDVFPIEQAGFYKGTYHVLHGAISPMEGIGPDDLKTGLLLQRIQGNGQLAGVQEIVIATNPSIEGEATALYLCRLLRPLGISITRLASGLPVGASLEYTDRQTIHRAFENRTEMS